MKKNTLTCTLVLLMAVSHVSFDSIAADIEDSTLHVTYLGATGYLIESSGKKVLVEPTFGDVVEGFGYPFPVDAVQEDIQNARGVFSNIDLVLISHVHLGHCDPVKTIELLNNHTGATIITTSEVYDALKNSTDNIAMYDPRLYVPEIDTYSPFNTTINDIPVSITKIDHWGPTLLLQYTLNIDGITIAFYLDYQKQDGAGHHVQTKGIDLGILDAKIFLNDDSRTIFGNDFEVGYSLYTHTTSFSSLNSLIEENIAQFPNQGIYTKPMEKFIYTFNNKEVTVDTLNNCPVVLNEVANDTVQIGEAVSINLPENIFEDADGDDLNISFTQLDGSDVPAWLNVDLNSMTLTGTAPEAQNLKLRIHATDPSNAYAKEDFTIVVESATGVENVQDINEINIYPNPAENYINIDLRNSAKVYSEYIIYSDCGAIVKQGQIETGELNMVDTESLSADSYLIKVSGTKGSYNKIFVKY